MIAARSVAPMNSAVSQRSDWHSFVGLIIVIVGLIITVAQLVGHEGSALWMWVYPVELAVLAIPVPRLRLNATQRTAALTMVATFAVLWIDDIPWLAASGVFPWIGDDAQGGGWWTICVPPVIAVIGCVVGQLPRGIDNRKEAPAQ